MMRSIRRSWLFKANILNERIGQMRIPTTDPAYISAGAILRINNDTHSVVVLKVDGDKITVAEGNYNSSVHWGRVIDINNCGFVYGYTRRLFERAAV